MLAKRHAARRRLALDVQHRRRREGFPRRTPVIRFDSLKWDREVRDFDEVHFTGTFQRGMARPLGLWWAC